MNSRLLGMHLTLVVLSIILIGYSEAGKNIDQHQSNGFCFKQIPRRSLSGQCAEDDFCEEMVNYTTNYGFKCGTFGECIVKHPPQQEVCKTACENSPCGKLCLQEHETKVANYCIKTRDHPQALPSNATEINKFYCVCVSPEF